MDTNAKPAFLNAAEFALRHHGAVAQARKGTEFPYVVHPFRVAEILSQFGLADEVVVAGFLHDTVEDTEASQATIREEFGERVAELVSFASEPDKTLAWKPRKEHTIETLRTASDFEALGLVAADKLDNIRALEDNLRRQKGSVVWKMFNAPKADQRWYYRAIAAALLERDPRSSLFRTLDYETQTLFPDVGHTTAFFPGKPFSTPHDARRYLADPIRHWRPERSAQELATSWVGAAGIPTRVRDVLATTPPYAECRLIEGFFEREVELGSAGNPSQTDLLALVELPDGYGVIAVEGKARETFGDLVSKWMEGSDDSPERRSGKPARLNGLCEQLEIDVAQTGRLRYQLLHRTV
ncbi:MAG TPA: HD domain-containing protein, partial [Microbacteriaceae bacterium]|nr:HD domain-containing protein [Microbacteriaceae bacterium]